MLLRQVLLLIPVALLANDVELVIVCAMVLMPVISLAVAVKLLMLY